MMQALPARAFNVLSYFTRHKTAANLLLLVMIVLGVLSLTRMRAQFFPDVVFETVSVSVAWPGAGPDDVDRGIIQVLEPELLVIEGVEEVASTSREGSAQIVIDFESGWDMARGLEDIKSSVEAQQDLPETAEEPQFRRFSFRDRVTDVVIAGPVGLDQLARFTDEFSARLYANGVTNVSIMGIAAPQVLIEVKSRDLRHYDLTLRDIANAVSEQSKTVPSGDLNAVNARLRAGQERRVAQDVKAIVLRTDEAGRHLTVADVAKVTDLGLDREKKYYVNNAPALTMRVDRSADGDAIGIQKIVQEQADTFVESLPEGMEISLVRTRAEAISGRLNILLDNAVMGLALVLGLLFIFLNARTAFWVAMGIPTALCLALALMYGFGLTINMISLFALILTLGIVVDDAIVVGEHADWRARQGEGSFEAAENAARRMAMPVFSATLTTIIAFFGLVAVGGRFGDLIADIPITVILVLTASFIECFLILPHHMAHSLKQTQKTPWYDQPSRIFNIGFRWFRDTVFLRFVQGVIIGRYVVLAIAVVLLAQSVAMVIKGDVPWRFFNPPEQSSITGNFVMLEGAQRSDAVVMMQEMQRAVETAATTLMEERGGENPVKFTLGQIGGGAGRGISSASDKDQDLLGAVSIELIDADLRPYSSAEFISSLQKEIKRTALTETVTFRGGRWGPGGDAIDIQLWGAESATLKAAAAEIKSALAVYPEVSGLDDSLPYGKDELRITLTVKGRALGFDVSKLGQELRDRLGGVEALSFPSGTRSGTVQVAIPSQELSSDFLEFTLLRSPAGQYVPLMDIVHVERVASYSVVERENGLRLISVTGDLSEDDPDRANFVQETLTNEILPDIAARYQLDYRLSGLAEQERRFLGDAKTGFFLCIVGIYMVLALVFASWTQPFVVMAVIPFGLVGAVWGHAYFDVPLSMFSVVGLLGMTGIIINDSIVLLTSIQQEAKEKPLVSAIIHGTIMRLRPVLLTTLTTVLGLAPLLFETSRDAQFLKPTVITLVFGLGFGMVLVLVVVPALLRIGVDFGYAMRSLRRALQFKRRAMRLAMRFSALVVASGAVTLCWLYLQRGEETAWNGSLIAAGYGAAFVTILIALILGMRMSRRPAPAS